MRVVVCTDLEGIGGVDRSEACFPAWPAGYRRAQELMEGEVSAVLEGLREAGATPSGRASPSRSMASRSTRPTCGPRWSGRPGRGWGSSPENASSATRSPNCSPVCRTTFPGRESQLFARLSSPPERSALPDPLRRVLVACAHGATAPLMRRGVREWMAEDATRYPAPPTGS